VSNQNYSIQANTAWDAGRHKEALKLFMKAADHGDSVGFFSLGYFYDAGIAVRKNIPKAICFYRKAGKLGHVAAYSNIGTIYRDIGNKSRARFWFLKAVEHGVHDAYLELAKLRLSGDAKHIHIDQARDYLKAVLASKYVVQVTKEEAREILISLSKNSALRSVR
jgi:TPR repeat protein